MANIVAAVPGIVDAVVNVGWWVANANRVREIVNRGMEIADERSKDCVRIFQNAIESMLQKGGQIFGKWNKAAIGAANVITAVYINHLVHKYSPEKCKDDSFSLDCLPNLAATSVCSVAIAGWGVKTVYDLRSSNSSLEQQGSGGVEALESNARVEETERQLSPEKVYGVENRIPYFLVNRLFKGFKLIEFNNPLNLKVHIKKDSLLIQTPHRLSGKNSGIWSMSEVDIEDKKIAKVSIEDKNIRIRPGDVNDSLKIQIIKYLCYPNRKLHVLEFEVYSEKKSSSTTIKIERDYDEFIMNFMSSRDNLTNLVQEISR